MHHEWKKLAHVIAVDAKSDEACVNLSPTATEVYLHIMSRAWQEFVFYIAFIRGAIRCRVIIRIDILGGYSALCISISNAGAD